MEKRQIGQTSSDRSEAQSVPISVDAIDYDLAGANIINGTSRPFARINVHLNNRLIAGGSANSGGKWRIITADNPSESDFEVWVDQVDRHGKVQKPAKMKFKRPAEPRLKAKILVNVERGSSLWKTARRRYGKGILYSVIFDANQYQIVNPDLIYPDQVFFRTLQR